MNREDFLRSTVGYLDVMLALRDLPQREHLQSLKREFPQMDVARMETYLALLKTATDMVRRIDAYLMEHGLQQNRFMLLVVLYRDPSKPLAAAELAASIGVKPPTLTGLLEGLVKKKWVKRQRDSGDRRAIGVVITAAGQEYLRGVLPGYYALINEMWRGVSRAEGAELRKVLEKISI